MRRIFYFILPALIGLAMLGSCSTHRSPLPYFRDIDSMPQGLAVGDFNVKIEPDDELFITVSSAQPEATAQYNLPLTNPGSTSVIGTSTQSQQMTYIVDSHGDIIMPVIGKLHVAGLTLEQLENKVYDYVARDVADPIVGVRLVNFKVNVGGEVKTPGQYPVKSRRFTVLDALASAGDLTEYAERNSVLVIREENGQRTYARLNLNSADALQSPYFYLKQNDYVYVEPNQIRQENSKYNQNNSFKLSVISTIVSGCSVITSLIIALALKK